jgi:hypothetical protein
MDCVTVVGYQLSVVDSNWWQQTGKLEVGLRKVRWPEELN